MEGQYIKMDTIIVYSRRLKNYIVNRGIRPITHIENPQKKGFTAWVFEHTDELSQIMSKYQRIGEYNGTNSNNT